MRGVFGLAVEVWTFESPEGLQIPNFGSVGLHPHTLAKVGLRPLKMTNQIVLYYISKKGHP
jgi:hypothetical protein